MVELQELHQILKSKTFKSKVEGSSDSFTFNFTEIYIFRDQKPLCIYELVKDKTGFKFIFGHLFENVSKDNFKNVTIVIEGDNRFPIVVNSDNLAIQNGQGFDISLIGQ